MLTPLVVGDGHPFQVEVLHAMARAGFDSSRHRAPELDVSSLRDCQHAIRASRANVVIDCGGADDYGADDRRRDPRAITTGAANLAHAAADEGAHSVFVSSVAVFGDAGWGERLESDPPAPASRLARAIADAERFTAQANPRYTIVRSGPLYGCSWPGVFEQLLARARAHEELAVEPRQVCPPTFAPQLANLLVFLIRHLCYGIIHRTAGGDCNELDLARALIREAEPDCRVISAPSWPSATVRLGPSAILASRRDELPELPHWHIGLRLWALEQQQQPA